VITIEVAEAPFADARLSRGSKRLQQPRRSGFRRDDTGTFCGRVLIRSILNRTPLSCPASGRERR
jgi:hypothetical protein